MGAPEGFAVGEVVGDSEGACDGAEVGSPVGTAEGKRVGAKVGVTLVGAFEVSTQGPLLANPHRVGAADGGAVGTADGRCVGKTVGVVLGRLVGGRVGEIVVGGGLRTIQSYDGTSPTIDAKRCGPAPAHLAHPSHPLRDR